MNRLKDILSAEGNYTVIGDADRSVSGLKLDSRLVETGDVFFALRGALVDGYDYISSAIDRGAVCVVGDERVSMFADRVVVVVATDPARLMGEMAAAFHDHPSRKLSVVGITGTNGKTTTATTCWQLFRRLGFGCGLISTVRYETGEKTTTASHTTPDALTTQQLLAEMVESGCDYAFMEVSSHALVQERVAGIDFAGAVFTNLSHDHLDFHGDFKSYIEAKKRLFDGLANNAFALVNRDDKRAGVMVQNTAATVLGFGIKSMADYKGRLIEQSIAGLQLDFDGIEWSSPLLGDFNAYNLLAAYAVARQFKIAADEILRALSTVRGVRGRFERIADPSGNVTAVVDYAHTPDALEKLLKAIDKFRRPNQTVVSVVGCGGDRDRAKRPQMARIAQSLSNIAVLTSDNPRTEDPEAILDEMFEGVRPDGNRVIRRSDRRAAIGLAVELARPSGIVAVAGKGHETYQEINGQRRDFDDAEVIRNAFQTIKTNR